MVELLYTMHCIGIVRTTQLASDRPVLDHQHCLNTRPPSPQLTSEEFIKESLWRRRIIIHLEPMHYMWLSFSIHRRSEDNTRLTSCFQQFMVSWNSC